MAVKQSDVDFLRQYAAGGGVVLVQGPNGQYQQANAAPPTVQLQAAPPTTPLNQGNAPTQAGTGGTGAPLPNRNQLQTVQQQRAAQRAQQQQQRAQRQAFQRGAMTGLEAVGGRFAAFSDSVNTWSERAARVPTPGGIGVMLAALVFLNFAVVPVNQGHTRLELLWMTFLNQTFIPEAQAVDDARDSGQLGADGQGSQGASSQGNPVVGGILGAAGGLLPGLMGASGSKPTISIPANGQLPIAPPLPSNGIRGMGA